MKLVDEWLDVVGDIKCSEEVLEQLQRVWLKKYGKPCYIVTLFIDSPE
jgi:hypothetical protein